MDTVLFMAFNAPGSRHAQVFAESDFDPVKTAHLAVLVDPELSFKLHHNTVARQCLENRRNQNIYYFVTVVTSTAVWYTNDIIKQTRYTVFNVSE